MDLYPNVNISVPDEFLEKAELDLDPLDKLFFKVNGHYFSEFNPYTRWYSDLEEEDI